MTLTDQNHDLTPFLPSSWISNLLNVPTLGDKYEIIDLNEKFIEYIESDGLYFDNEKLTYASAFSSSDECSESDSENSVSFRKPSELFPEIDSKLRAAIDALGGSVVPKLNWTVPKDSVWISANTLKCTSISEVYQLIKASDRIQSDLELSKSFKYVPQLFLRPFVEIRPEFEFRAFVINRELVAISQRNLDIFDGNLMIKSQSIIDSISSFFVNFFGNFDSPTFSFDVYLSNNYKEALLVDVNPLTETTSTGLFKYAELEKLQNDHVDEIIFKCIESNEDTIIGLSERNFLPADLFNADSDISKIDFNNFLQ